MSLCPACFASEDLPAHQPLNILTFLLKIIFYVMINLFKGVNLMVTENLHSIATIYELRTIFLIQHLQFQKTQPDMIITLMCFTEKSTDILKRRK